MNYQEAMTFIHGTYQFGSKLGLENIKNLLSRLGNPQQDLPIIHVAGTNGKGSTAAFLHSILKAGGYRVGLYTSPYLEKFTERMQINGEPIPEESLAKYTAVVKEKIQEMVEAGKNHPTEFEVVTAIAFCYFAAEEVDYLILEVGLGGRLDATNVIEKPLVSVITPLGYDHTQYLGDTLEAIAYEKGGIIKENSVAVLVPQEPGPLKVLRDLCAQRHTACWVVDSTDLQVLQSTIEGQVFHATVLGELYENLKISLAGTYQIQNSLTALWVIEGLKQHRDLRIEREAIYQGLLEARWPGRFEVMKKEPLTVIDGAHNPHGAAALRQAVRTLLKDYHLTLVIGMLADKDIKEYLELIIPEVDRVVATEPDNPRAMKAEQLAEQIRAYDRPCTVVPQIEAAVKMALEGARSGDAVLVAGSLYLIGEARKIIQKIN